MTVSLNSRDGEASDDANAIQVDNDEECSDDDHQQMVEINPEVQSEVTNDAASMTELSDVNEEPNFGDSIPQNIGDILQGRAKQP
jgi:hypothetical protein